MLIKNMEYEDLPYVQKLNILNLPENYNMSFYIYHLATYPGLSFICFIDDKVVGYVIGKIEDDDGKTKGHIVSLCVDKPYRRRGVAGKMLDALLDAFSTKQNEKLCVGLRVRLSNKNAISFYKKNEFKITNEEKNYYVDGESAYIMERNIAK